MILIFAIILVLLWVYLRLHVKKLHEYSSPHLGKIQVLQKYDGERVLTTNGFPQGVSIEKKSIEKSYWYFQFQQVVLHCKQREKSTVLWLGLGAGTGPHLVAKSLPDLEQTAIELDPRVIQAGKKYFGLENVKNLSVVQADAFKKIEEYLKNKKTFDVVVVDIYKNDAPSNGEQSSDDSFLEKLSHVVKSDGLLIFNRLAHEGIERERTKLLITRLKAYFTDVHTKYIQDPRGYKNDVVTATKRK